MITVRGVRKKFRSVLALDDLEFQCAPGEIVALIGPNGSGKSTALRILAGIMRADRGEVRIGQDAINMSSAGVRSRISYLPQRVTLPDQVTAREALAFFGRIRRVSADRVSELISRFGFQGFESKKVGELSGGMLQRLAIAVVFLPLADSYILDEPTNNLDADGLARFRRATGRNFPSIYLPKAASAFCGFTCPPSRSRRSWIGLKSAARPASRSGGSLKLVKSSASRS